MTITSPSPLNRAILAFVVPAIVALFAYNLTRGNLAVVFGSLGLTSWFMGLAWYKLPDMGIRGKRPLYSSIGFAFMGWVTLLIMRFILIYSQSFLESGLGKAFLFIFLFEAFCLQLWTFGLLFRSIVDWRTPLTAVFVSGVAFGVMGFSFFGESFVLGSAALIYFVVWGGFYGLIRLRTGSLLGMVIIQPLQTITVWHIFLPDLSIITPESAQDYGLLYFAMSIIYIMFIWRLWPKQMEDYRV